MLVCLLVLLAGGARGSFNVIPVVPFPQVVELVSPARRALKVEEFRITSEQEGLLQDKVIEHTVERYQHYFSRFKPGAPTEAGYIRTVQLQVENPHTQLHIGVNETYTLEILEGSETVSLSASTRFGVVRGLETLYQLYNVSDNTFPSVKITDYPRFSYRGFLIDTSRHFLSTQTIRKVISGLAMAKFNVLHWHIVDDPSFPYYSAAFPSLSEKGAYDENHVYKISDILEVIDYAESHGVVVVPEFDTPGHTLSWGKGLKDFLTHCPGVGTFGGDYGPIDPSREENYQILTKLFTEITSLFPSQFVHLGGDEVPFNCWEANKELVSWMRGRGIKTFPDLENYYEDRLLDIIHSLNHSYVVWEEIFTNGLKIQPDTIVHVWKGKWNETLSSVVRGGYRAILSSPWYLNYIHFSPDWEQYYKVEPYDIPGATPAQLALILGGEACMWGEFVDNTNILSRTFPRASAVGERLWSSQKQRNTGDMGFRLNVHRCGMCVRDIPAHTIIMRSTHAFCPFEFSGYDY